MFAKIRYRNCLKTDHDVMIDFRWFTAITVAVNVAFFSWVIHTGVTNPEGFLQIAFYAIWAILTTIATGFLPMCIVCWMELPEEY